ncbi:DNA methyltransferase [Hydrogenophaga sp. PBC]|uniref:DNA methyltransferase n=1 Tax=Hydrogenophaga sp. PBC TaxID=795665 RepID=UPI0002608BC9|nr:DNA methyltransferase [Hydrogenophaga sp. PBC]
MYKTISYPRHESGTGQIERLRIAISADHTEFSRWLSALSSKEARDLLAHSYTELNQLSTGRETPVSQLATEILRRAFDEEATSNRLAPATTSAQLVLFGEDVPLGKHGTFSPNHIESIHRWYPYIEGFSSTFVRNLITKWGPNASSVYDPFGGTGTTVTVGAMMGLRSLYSEINPFMRHVIEGKTNVLRKVARKTDDLAFYFSELSEFSRRNLISANEALDAFSAAFSDRPYFVPRRLIEILSIRNAIATYHTDDANFRHLALLALGSIAVQCSEMKRAADLRYRLPKETLPEDFSVFDCFEQKLKVILDDIDYSLTGMQPVECLNEDALAPAIGHRPIDLIVTSPPYLNGTNYFRNTKIELWLTGFIQSEKDLGYFTRRAVTAGINNVSKNGRDLRLFDFVEPVARQLDEVAYDRRIPELVRRYCSDAEVWLRNCFQLLSAGGRAVIDIGDSRFAGVHVPTEKFLEQIAEGVGFEIYDAELVRNRTSKDGSTLSQVLLVLEKPGKSSHRGATKVKAQDTLRELREAAKEFERSLPHQREPFSSRNWGHPLHSLCSYQGKLKPAIAHFLVTQFTKPGDVVLDPMSGAGTIPLEAFLNGRRAFANDLQELGYMLSSAKVGRPQRAKVLEELESLLCFVEQNYRTQNIEQFKDFGFNGKLKEYFEERTFKEILAARTYIQSNKCDSTERAVVYSSLLHILHGNRPYALSRRSHPVTPLKPTGEFEYRDMRSRLSEKVSRAMASYDDARLLDGKSTFGCFEDLDYRGTVDAVITSPPFAASTRFYIANWLRLWMSGWGPEDFSEKKERFVEHRQKLSFDVYGSFFEKCNQWLKPDGIVIMHLGRTNKHDMAKELIAHCGDYFEVAHCFDEDVVGRENFGLKDQGATKAHQYLFLAKRT